MKVCLWLNERVFLFLEHVLRIQIPRRAGITSQTAVHAGAVNFVVDEQILVRGVRVNAELGNIAKKTFAGSTLPVRE